MVLPANWRAYILGRVQENGDDQDTEVQTGKIDAQLERLRFVFIPGDIPEAEYRQERTRLLAKPQSLQPRELPDLESGASGKLPNHLGSSYSE